MVGSSFNDGAMFCKTLLLLNLPSSVERRDKPYSSQLVHPIVNSRHIKVNKIQQTKYMYIYMTKPVSTLTSNNATMQYTAKGVYFSSEQ